MQKLRLGKITNWPKFTVNKWHGQYWNPDQVVYLKDKPTNMGVLSDTL